MKKSEKKLVLKWKKALKQGKRPKIKSLRDRVLFDFLCLHGVLREKLKTNHRVYHQAEVIEELAQK